MKEKIKVIKTMFRVILLGIIFFATGSVAGQNCNPKFTYSADSTGYIISFKDTSLGNVSNCYWSFGDGFSSTAKDPHHQYLSSGKYPVCLTVVDSNQSCYGTFCDTISIGIVNNFCQANFIYSQSGLGSFQFTDLSLGLPTNWQWDFGDGHFSSLQNPSHQYSLPGNYLVCLSIADANFSCYSNWCDTVNLTPSLICKANFNAFPDSSTGVNFQNLSAAKNVLFDWDFGDNKTSHQKDPYHQYAMPGSYYVCLTIQDTIAHCSDTYCQIIYAYSFNTNCQASYFSQVDSTGNGFHFINSSQGGTYYFWSFGDGSFSQDFDPHHVYSQPGTYQVCLTISDNSNTCADSVCTIISAGNNSNACKAYFNYSAGGVGDIYFANNSAGSSLFSQWSFGDGTYSLNLNPTHTYSQPGYYQVCLNIIDSIHNCSDVYCDTVYVMIQSSCKAAFSSHSDSLGTGVQFFDMSVSALSYQWNFGDGSFSNQQSPHHVYASPGSYLVCLSISNYMNSCYDSVCQLVVVTKTQLGCQAYFVDSVLSNGAIAFMNHSIGSMSNYSWNFGDGTYSNQQNPLHYYSQAGMYQVCLSLSDNLQSCNDVYCQSVYVGSLNCQAAFVHHPDSIGNGIYFSNTSKGGISYLWSFGDGHHSVNFDPHHVYANSGYYQVCLTINDSIHSCADTYCDYVYVTGCNIGFTYQIDTIHAGAGVLFHDYSSNINTGWYWDFGDSSYSSQKSPNHVFPNPGAYWVCMSVVGNNPLCNGIYCDTVVIKSFSQGFNDDLNRKVKFEVYPNPFHYETNISFDLVKSGKVLLEIYSLTGIRQKTLQNAQLVQGNHRISFSAESMELGLYFLKLTLEDTIIVSKLQIIK